MTPSAVTITVARLQAEESFRADVYDDATGLSLTCSGEPTIGFGCRCRAWSRALSMAVLQFQVDGLDAQLAQYPWYPRIVDPMRQSVILDAAFNLGLSGLVNGYPRFVAAVGRGDWVAAAAELHVKQSKLDNGRYATLRQLLIAGSGN